MPRERTILRQIASHHFIRTVYRAWVQTARGYSTVYPREVTDSTWVLLRGFFYSGFRAGQGTRESTDRAAAYVKNDGKSRRPCCYGRGRNATSSRTLRQDGRESLGTSITKRRTDACPWRVARSSSG